VSGTLVELAATFALLSFLAVGGANGVIPEMQHQVVDVHHWLSAREFLDVFAISRAAPGPGSLIVVPIGLRGAGAAGAIVSLIAMFLPSCLLVYAMTRLWRSARLAAWRHVVEAGLAPIAVGLTFAGGLALLRTTETGWPAYLITAGATLVLSRTEISPLPVLLGGAALGALIGA
jgi:chromate transporter